MLGKAFPAFSPEVGGSLNLPVALQRNTKLTGPVQGVYHACTASSFVFECFIARCPKLVAGDSSSIGLFRRYIYLHCVTAGDTQLLVALSWLQR